MSLGISCGLKVSLTAARLVVVLVNVPIMIIALQGYNIAYIYLIANMTTACTTFPIALGLLDSMDHVLTGESAVFGSVAALISVIIYGWIRTGSITMGIVTYFCQTYDAGAFLIGSCCSILWTFVWIYAARLYGERDELQTGEESQPLAPVLIHESVDTFGDQGDRVADIYH